MAQDSEMGASFPVKGLDVTCEYGRQPQDTTAAAVNVVSFETLASRGRGGSRSGLTKLLSERLDGDAVIQHLCVLVDPQGPAFAGDDDESIADPSTNNLRTRNAGRFMRPGGSAKLPKAPVSTAAIEFVQKGYLFPGNVSAVQTLTLASQPESNSLLVLVVRTEKIGAAAELVSGVANSAGNAFTRVGTAGYTSEVASGGSVYSLSMFYRVANAGAQDQVVKVTPGASGVYEIAVLEYRNAATAGPLSDNEKAADTGSVASFSVAGLSLNGTTGQLVVAAFTEVNCNVASGGGYVGRYGVPADPESDAANMAVVEKTGLSGVTPENPTVTPNVARPYAGIAAAFTR